MKKIAIIGGTGLEDPKILSDLKEIDMETPFGQPDQKIREGRLNDVSVYLLSRHGHQHTIPPTQVNNRANIWAVKELQCDGIIATTACGSLRHEIDRGHFVIPDQFIDFTRHRNITFFDAFKPGELVHTPMAEPFNGDLRSKLIQAGKKLNLSIHERGTVITIEGPRFSTRAESKMFRAWGADIINMSTAPEAILANELKLPYAAVAMSTDYDCWKEDEEAVTWEEVLRIFRQNVHNVIDLLLETLKIHSNT
jgi:5'-methylthioadenosine phosphorylase